MIEIIRTFDSVFYFLIALLLFLFTRRLLSIDILLLLQKITRSAHLAHKIHFFLVLPGVFLHEFSHFLALRIMGVSSTLHLGIEMGQEAVVYGHVDFYEKDVNAFKHFITGIAPLLTGLLSTTFLAIQFMGVPSIQELIKSQGQINFQSILDQTEKIIFWIAFYLLFAIASEMLPSASDRKYWLPLAGFVFILMILSLLTNTYPWLLSNIYPFLSNWLKILAMIFTICLIPQLILLIPLRLLRSLTSPRRA